jgi:peptidylamidoglycolate lyase
MLSPTGALIGQIGIEEGMVVPHSLTLLEREDLICVADREKRRILCFSAGLTGNRPGKLMFNIQHPALGRVFAIDHFGDLILAVNGPDERPGGPVGVSLDLATEQVLNTWAPKSGFFEPHDLATSPDGSSFYVTEIGTRAPRKVYKFLTVVQTY